MKLNVLNLDVLGKGLKCLFQCLTKGLELSS